MENEISFAIFQMNIAWENIQKNIEKIKSIIPTVLHCDVLVLPEMCTTGFTMNPTEYAVSMEHESINSIKQLSKKIAICGSFCVAENKQYYNRFIWFEHGEIKYIYDKKHLFSLGKENQFYVAGNKKLVINYKGFLITPFICYDLRFPVWCRNTNDAEIMLFVANWPEVRAHAWRSLLQARAIENVCVVISCNRVGIDGNGVNHSGSSMHIHCDGTINEEIVDKEKMFFCTVKKNEIHEFRNSFPFLKDKD